MQQIVDPFMPVRGQYATRFERRPVVLSRSDRPNALISRSVLRPRVSQVVQPSTLDGIMRPRMIAPKPTRPHIEQAPPSPWRQSIKHTTPVSGKAKAEKTHRTLNLWRTLRLPLAIVATLGIGLFAPSLLAGEIIIGLYAIFALIRGVSSRTTFLLALAALMGIVVLLAFQGNDDTSNNFAVYAFLLLAVGTITLGKEVHAANA